MVHVGEEMVSRGILVEAGEGDDEEGVTTLFSTRSYVHLIQHPITLFSHQSLKLLKPGLHLIDLKQTGLQATSFEVSKTDLSPQSTQSTSGFRPMVYKPYLVLPK